MGGNRGALLTGQLRISAQREGLVSAGLPRWLCAPLPGEDSAAGRGRMPASAPHNPPGVMEGLKGPQTALPLGTPQRFPTGFLPSLHEKIQGLVLLPPSLRRGLL